MNGGDERLRTIQLTKTFPGVVAVDKVDFDVRPGEIHALVGENGAGKSTLIKILGGMYLPDSGQIVMDGRPVAFGSTHESLASGISVIYQEFNLVPDLTVAENIFIGREPKTALGTLIDFSRLNARAAELPPGSEGLVVLDHWQGNRTPWTDPWSRGVIRGLTLGHGPAHVYRAILEGAVRPANRVGLGSAIAALAKPIGGLELDTKRDKRPARPADLA
jgi:ABC-type sugar transport system ATPase subunit